ncbi:MAG TPA: hypothetical protein VGN26_15985 [Armatimonadota bacterium]
MRVFVEWVWNGPWWAPIPGAVYVAVLLGIALGPILAAVRADRR